MSRYLSWYRRVFKVAGQTLMISMSSLPMVRTYSFDESDVLPESQITETLRCLGRQRDLLDPLGHVVQ